MDEGRGPLALPRKVPDPRVMQGNGFRYPETVKDLEVLDALERIEGRVEELVRCVKDGRRYRTEMMLWIIRDRLWEEGARLRRVVNRVDDGGIAYDG